MYYTIYEIDLGIIISHPIASIYLFFLAKIFCLTYLIFEKIRKGRVSDNVVGQIQRYMGYVKEYLAEPHQEVKGIIIGSEDDLKIRRALSVTTNIEFYKYKVNFKLHQ